MESLACYEHSLQLTVGVASVRMSLRLPQLSVTADQSVGRAVMVQHGIGLALRVPG